MFTGIIEEIGRVRSIEKRSGYQQTILHAALVLEGMKVGDSVTLNGVCHTVVVFHRARDLSKLAGGAERGVDFASA